MFAVGVDVSNGKSTVAVMGSKRTVVVKSCEVPHTTDGFAKLAARLHALNGEVRIVMEHTGRYYESFAMSMYRAGFFVSAVNPLAIKDYREGIPSRTIPATRSPTATVAANEVLPTFARRSLSS